MTLPISNDSGGVHNQKPDSEAKQPNASSPQKPDFEVTTPLSQEATAASRKKAPRSNYGKNYRPTFALVESGEKCVIVKINDVGPLKPDRVIDLSERSMRYFDPTQQLGLIGAEQILRILACKKVICLGSHRKF
jgi:rare lipoprotein A